MRLSGFQTFQTNKTELVKIMQMLIKYALIIANYVFCDKFGEMDRKYDGLLLCKNFQSGDGPENF